MPVTPNNDYSARIRRTLDDLAVIRETLLADAEPVADSVGPSLSLDLQLASELKSVVDTLQRLLWAYIQALSSKSGRPPDEVLNWYKMELAVEMLRSVRARGKATSAANSESFSFDELVSDAMAVTSLHSDKKKPSTNV
ncbi:MAG TPA: hypothetical protein VJ723_10300 [Candidatus Angelobacter sp.]|nr:hypothetical protein [Candidatus Angelobacter sp.]